MLPRKLQLSLVIGQLVASATIIRSVAYDRWVTVGVALLMLVGMTAAKRHRTWGVGLAFAAACSLVSAVLLGFASPLFLLVGGVGALPLVLASPAMRRFDTRAATLFTLLSASMGITFALAWRPLALALVELFPSLTPSLTLQHGGGVVASSVALVVAGRSLLRSLPPERDETLVAETRARAPAKLRVSTPNNKEESLELEGDERSDKSATA